MIQATEDTVSLAIETTGRLGSLAVLRGTSVLHYVNLSPSGRTAANLAPEVNRTLDRCRQSDSMPEFLSVADGPGSFTGLRIGVTTAKSLAYALGLPLVAVDSLASIAAAAMHAETEIESITVALDAYRQQVYTGSFARNELLPPLQNLHDDWHPHPSGVECVDLQHWKQRLANLPNGAFLAGDRKLFADRADSAANHTCDAIGTGLLGIRAAITNQWTDPLKLVPRYLKPSAAEEKRVESEK